MSLYVEQTILYNQQVIMLALQALLMKHGGSAAMLGSLESHVKATRECIKEIS